MTKFKTKFSLTIYGDNFSEVEKRATEQLAGYLDIPAESVESLLDVEIVINTNDGTNEEFDSDWFKATVYASVKRNAVNFAK